MSIHVGVYDAKTQLSELISRVQAGERVTITVRGVPTVDLVPAGADKAAQRRAAGAALRAMMESGPQVSDDALADMRAYGRK